MVTCSLEAGDQLISDEKYKKCEVRNNAAGMCQRHAHYKSISYCFSF